MDNKGEQLKKMRKKSGFSIEEVAEATNIRDHIIEALELNEEIDLPAPYINSFVKSLIEFYEKFDSHQSENIENEQEEPESASVLYDKNENVFKSTDDIEEEEEIFVDEPEEDKPNLEDDIEGFELVDNNVEEVTKENSQTIKNTFKKYKEKKSQATKNKKIKNTDYKSNSNRSIYLVYLALGLFLLSIIYFIFFYKSGEAYDEVTSNATVDTLNIKNKHDKENEILLRLTQDSIVFVAIAKDSAWIKIDIDGKAIDEIVMSKGETKRWTAANYFILSTSNLGNIDFYKNDTLIPQLGAAGSMIKNIKIAHKGLANVRPLADHYEEVPIQNINSNNMQLNAFQVDDTLKKKVIKRRRKRRKKKKKKTMTVLDFSNPQTIKPNILEESKKEEKDTKNK